MPAVSGEADIAVARCKRASGREAFLKLAAAWVALTHRSKKAHEKNR
jgi:hypothetical protein